MVLYGAPFTRVNGGRISPEDKCARVVPKHMLKKAENGLRDR